MLFEIRDLCFATPATVSRAGIIYISSDDGNLWHSMIASWVQSQPDEIYSAQSKAVRSDVDFWSLLLKHLFCKSGINRLFPEVCFTKLKVFA
jgi:hypothetical protein